ncbi:hypothetical protein BN1232_06428 [Mycobacterium lentiflavum]|nr:MULTISPECIES: DUF732 domain-containing protein [Mycobacterium simiae complex]ULP45480.1 DUF732 domain-containing protein [Mycobacterium lentiflavum]CQD24864.1 hypothetical protein BN1232_06428 [Mycobacterium lentiflavum]
MKRLFAVLGVFAMIGFAAPAYAEPVPDPDGDDGAFLATLRQAGFTFSSESAAIAAGRAVCSSLNNGESGLELVHDVKNHNPGMSMEMASDFALISAKFYCPHQLSKA